MTLAATHSDTGIKVGLRATAASVMGGMLNEPLAQRARQERADWEETAPKRREMIAGFMGLKKQTP